MKVCFETFGCRLNRAEALQQEAELNARGWVSTASHSEANLIIVRGCSVTSRAQRDCEKLIAHLKRKYPFKRIVIQGCLPDRTRNFFVKSGAEPAVPTRTARAYLKVQDGCAGMCTFCTVPRFRGASRSVDFTETIDRAKRFIDAGYHEIVVTGCNLSLYASQGKRLDGLLSALASLSPDCRIRIGSLEPSPVALDVVQTMAETPNACRYLHVPIQSGSNRILSLMRRPYSASAVTEIAYTAARLMPDLGFGCDLITGFPGETEVDFLATKSLLKRLPVTKAHVFPFSARPGTPAAKSPDQIAPTLRASRAHELLKIADALRGKFIRKFVGREIEIVIEDERNLAGWSGEYVWCQCLQEGSSTPAFKRKSRMKVRGAGVTGHILLGIPV